MELEKPSRRKTSSGYRYARENREHREHREHKEHKEHREREDYEFDFNDISRASTPTSTFSSKSEGRKKDREHRYSVDDYRRKIARLKSELDLERAKSKKAHKEKSSELRDLRESYEVRKQTEIGDLEQKMMKRLDKEKKQLEENLRNSIMEEKDKELQDVLKYKEDEVKDLKKRYKNEKESAIKLAIENEKLVLAEKDKKTQEEVEKLKQEKITLEEEYKKKVVDEAKKEKEFAKIKEEYDSELRRILGESKKLALGNLEKLRKAERALNENCGESDDELNEMEFNEIMADLHTIQSQTSSRAVSRSVSTTSELKFDELNVHINNLLASPAVTPGPQGLSVTPGPHSQSVTPGPHGQSITPGPHGQSLTPGPLGQEGQSPLTVKGLNTDGKARSSSAMSEPARDVFNRKQEERDRHQQKKITELQTQTQRLERKIALLKTENETLKRKQDDKKPLEEKIKTLKKRNAELAAIARRLEEKAKHLQQENMKKAKEMAAGAQLASGVQGTDQMKKMFARQRAKDLSEHAKSMLAKDREIEDLRKKCQELADQLSNSDFTGPENSEMYEEKEELVSIIKLAAKEKLQMERQLAIAKPGPDSKVVSADKYRELEETNEALKQEINKLERAQSDSERLEIELTQKKLECERLTGEIEVERKESKTLEHQLSDSTTKNSQLTGEVTSLQSKLKQLEKVNEECSTLRLSLSDAQHECEVAKGEVTALQLKVQNLETVVQNLEFSTEKLKQVEQDYHETLVRLQEKQQEIDQLQKVQESAREKYETAIKSLQDKIQGLETQCHDHATRQQTLTEELTHLRAQAAQKPLNSRTTEIQTGNSIEFAPSSTSSPNQSPRHSPTPTGNPRKSPRTSVPTTPVNSSQKSSHVSPSSASSRKCRSHIAQSPSATNKEHNSKGTTPVEDVIQHHNAVPVQSTPKRVNGLNEQTESTKSGGTDTDKGDDSGMESRGDHCREPEVSEMSIGESVLSVLGKKGPIQVYIAKYSYDPYNYSPNENPEAELPLQAGDYVLICGEMDEDGFFEGELIDGRRGLVPSNFIEKVAEEDLQDFHAAMTMGGHDENSTTANSIVVPDLDLDSGDELDKQEDELVPTDQSSQIKNEPSSDLDDILEEEDEDISLSKHRDSLYNVHTGAPFPKNLQLDRQLANSILVSWLPPDNASGAELRSYHVFLDGDFKTAIRGSERTKALLENVESRKIHRVSVRCISSLGQSHDNQCTILVGKDVIPAPFDLRLGEITANSASMSWTPGDSSLHHAIFVNNVEVRVVKPGIFTHTLTGLSPATSHAVRIQAKNLHGKFEGNNIKPEKLSSTMEFKTPSGGVPDPPVSVLVESGPQEGSILLTWLPVTIETSGYSNGALVSGYSVYGDGQKVKQVLGATNDHCILTAADFTGPVPKELCVRTVTKDKIESVNSEVIKLPATLVKELSPSANKSSNESTHSKSPSHGKLPEDVVALEKQEKEIEALIGKSPLKSDKSAAAVKSHDKKQPMSSPHIEKKGNVVSPQNVPVIEITRESSVEQSPSKHSEDEHSDIKIDSVDSVNSSKVTTDNSAETNAKYSARMDTRDGYRDDSYLASSHSSSHHSKDHSKRDKSDDSSRKHGASPNNTTGRGSSPRHSKSASPGARASPRNRDNRESPRSRNSPRRADQHGSHDHGKSGASPQRDHAGRRSRSPTSSPATKTNVKSGYAPVEPLELSKLDQKQGSFADSDDDSITGEINPPVDDNRIRLFVALFDYDPETMSPNVDSLDEELPFKEGQIIKVFGDKDPDGFYRGESAGRIGYIPCNMVSEIQVDDPELEQQLMREVQENGSMSNSAISEQLSASDKYLKPITTNGVHLSPGDIPSISSDLAVRRMVALYDYDPQELSPNVDAELELTFKAGELVVCYGEMDDDGFYMGEMEGRRGLVPSNFLQECGASDEEALDSVSVVTPASLNNNNNTNNSGSRARVQAWSTPQQKWSTPNLIK